MGCEASRELPLKLRAGNFPPNARHAERLVGAYSDLGLRCARGGRLLIAYAIGTQSAGATALALRATRLSLFEASLAKLTHFERDVSPLVRLLRFCLFLAWRLFRSS